MMSYGVRVLMFNATFNNISVISWRSVLLVDEMPFGTIFLLLVYSGGNFYLLGNRKSYKLILANVKTHIHNQNNYKQDSHHCRATFCGGGGVSRICISWIFSHGCIRRKTFERIDMTKERNKTDIRATTCNQFERNFNFNNQFERE